MRKSMLLCTSVTALVLSSTSLLAQSERSPAGGSGVGAPAEMAPSQGAPDGSGPSLKGDGGASSGASEGAEGRDAGNVDAQGEMRGGKKPGNTAGSDKGRGDGSAASGASDGAEGRDGSKAGDKAAGNKAAGNKDDKGDKMDRKAGSDKDRSATEGASEGTSGSGDRPSGSVAKLSGEQRTKAQSAFRSHKSEAVVKDIDVEINIGVAVPRSVTLYAVPEDVVIIVPAYRRYKYFIFEDKVVIVDPGTFAIIDILILA